MTSKKRALEEGPGVKAGMGQSGSAVRSLCQEGLWLRFLSGDHQRRPPLWRCPWSRGRLREKPTHRLRGPDPDVGRVSGRAPGLQPADCFREPAGDGEIQTK